MHKIMNPDDVRMRQFEAALRLSFELIEHCMISNHQIGKKFQRDVALQLQGCALFPPRNNTAANTIAVASFVKGRSSSFALPGID